MDELKNETNARIKAITEEKEKSEEIMRESMEHLKYRVLFT